MTLHVLSALRQKHVELAKAIREAEKRIDVTVHTPPLGSPHKKTESEQIQMLTPVGAASCTGGCERLRIDRLKADMLHLDATIRLFDPDAESTLRQAQARMFKHGHLHREILDVVRQAGMPITPRAIAERLIADRPEIAGSKYGMGVLAGRVRKSLGRECAGLDRENGTQGEGAVWRVADEAMAD